MVVELGDDDVRQRREGRLAPRHSADRRGCLDDLLARPAAVFGADVAHDPPAHRHDVEHLVRVHAQPAQRTTAVRAGADTGRRLVDDLLARQMLRQTADRCQARRYSRHRSLDFRNIPLRFQLFQRQLELFDLAAQLLGGGTELHPPQSGDLPAQRVDEQIAGGERGIRPGERCLQRGDPRGGISRGNRRFQHPHFITDHASTGEKKRRKTAVFTPPASA